MIFISAIEDPLRVVQHIEVAFFLNGMPGQTAVVTFPVAIEVDFHPLRVVLASPASLLRMYPVFINIEDLYNSMSRSNFLRRNELSLGQREG